MFALKLLNFPLRFDFLMTETALIRDDFLVTETETETETKTPRLSVSDRESRTETRSPVRRFSAPG